MLQNLFSLGRHPASPFGQAPLAILGQISQAIPQTEILAPPVMPASRPNRGEA